jgi:hypothetical protein
MKLQMQQRKAERLNLKRKGGYIYSIEEGIKAKPIQVPWEVRILKYSGYIIKEGIKGKGNTSSTRGHNITNLQYIHTYNEPCARTDIHNVEKAEIKLPHDNIVLLVLRFLQHMSWFLHSH